MGADLRAIQELLATRASRRRRATRRCPSSAPDRGLRRAHTRRAQARSREQDAQRPPCSV
jgi:hypothetical protein